MYYTVCTNQCVAYAWDFTGEREPVFRIFIMPVLCDSIENLRTLHLRFSADNKMCSCLKRIFIQWAALNLFLPLYDYCTTIVRLLKDYCMTIQTAKIRYFEWWPPVFTLQVFGRDRPCRVGIVRKGIQLNPKAHILPDGIRIIILK